MPESNNDSLTLIRRFAVGDQEAFGRFYDRLAPLVFALAMRILKSQSDAEDLLQEVFLQAWDQSQAYDQKRGRPEAWISTICRTRAIDKLRSIRRRDQSFLLTEDIANVQPKEGDTASTLSRSETRLTLKSVLQGLPESQRQVVELAYFDGLTHSEIASRLGQPLGTVKTRMRTGIERMQELARSREQAELS